MLPAYWQDLSASSNAVSEFLKRPIAFTFDGLEILIMVFNSINFLIFFLAVCTLYYSFPHRWRIRLLLVASYFFYGAWKLEYMVLLAATTLVTYGCGLKIGRLSDPAKKRRFLILSIVANLCLLIGCKYLNFLNEAFAALLERFNIFYDAPAIEILLPVGISFYSFKSISYAMDVFRGIQAPEKRLESYALYVSFFPQLLAGPIERSGKLLAQFQQKIVFSYEGITSGMRLVAWGLFKKVVIADRIAVMVNVVYGNPHAYEGVHFALATFFYGYQIYCDFSGYSDIAIGSAKILGFESSPNFKHPYFAGSMSDFWKRWHISLSTWFRDYLYIPLGGNRTRPWRWQTNVMAVFLVSGLWHGADWTFVVWGGLHGFYLLFGIWTRHVRARCTALFRLSRFPGLQRFAAVLITFLLVNFAWIFFRAETLDDAVHIATHLFAGTGQFLANITDMDFVRHSLGKLGVSDSEFIISLLSIGLLEAVQLFTEVKGKAFRFTDRPVWQRWTAYYALAVVIIFFGSFNTVQDFVYLQF